MASINAFAPINSNTLTLYPSIISFFVLWKSPIQADPEYILLSLALNSANLYLSSCIQLTDNVPPSRICGDLDASSLCFLQLSYSLDQSSLIVVL